jgi:hypothetical protein
MAALACQVHLEMQFMLADRRDRGMAFGNAGVPIRPRLDMRVVAFIAIELHGCICRRQNLYCLLYGFLLWLKVFDIDGPVSNELFPDRFVTVAEKAFFSPRQEVLCTVGMAIEAGEGAHRKTGLRALLIAGLNGFLMRPKLLVFMAGEAVPLFHGELVCPVAVTLGALNLFVEDMLCMVPRPADVRCVRELLVPFPVAPETERSRDDDLAVPGRDSSLAEERKTVHLDDLVLLGGMVAFMAV